MLLPQNIGQVLCPLTAGKQKKKQKKKRRRVSRLSLSCGLPLNVNNLATQLALPADHVVLRPVKLNDLKLVLLLGNLLGSQTALQGLAPRSSENLAFKRIAVRVLGIGRELGIGEGDLSELLACLGVYKLRHHCLGAVALDEHAEAYA